MHSGARAERTGQPAIEPTVVTALRATAARGESGAPGARAKGAASSTDRRGADSLWRYVLEERGFWRQRR